MPQSHCLAPQDRPARPVSGLLRFGPADRHQRNGSADRFGDQARRFQPAQHPAGAGWATGLDFKPLSTAPVGFDIARILVDYAEPFQPRGDVPVGAMVSAATFDAFFDGYDVTGRDDPSVRFIPFVQLLNDWRLIPPDPSRRSWRQAARMTAIEALARNGFALK